MKLGVNIDHIAVLREARKINDPDPFDALGIVKRAGADQITIHLREDRRHIHDSDAKRIIDNCTIPVNLECSINEEIIAIVCKLKPDRATLVPEKREEVTTEGGLDLKGNFERMQKAITKLHAADIEVSLFIDPTVQAITLSEQLGVSWVELHTGTYANIFATLYSNLSNSVHAIDTLKFVDKSTLKSMLFESVEQLQLSATYAKNCGLKVAAGHGLNYNNLEDILAIIEIEELNIGQSIIARSIFTGLQTAVETMNRLVKS